MRQRNERTKDAVELDDFGHIAPPKENCLLRIDAEREVGERRVECVFAQRGGVANRCERMQVGDEVQSLAFILQLNELTQRSVVVAEVQRARGLDSRQDAQRSCLGCLTHGRASSCSPSMATLHVRSVVGHSLDDRPALVSEQAKSPLPVKEGQPKAARVCTHSALAQARDLAFAHERLDFCGFEVETVSDDSRLDADRAVFELDPAQLQSPAIARSCVPSAG